MAWLKDAYLDILVLLLFAIFAVYPTHVFEIIIWVYTGLLLLGKILAFFIPSLSRKASKTEAPSYFYHTIYALTVGIFIYIAKYYLAGAWLVIWIISTISVSASNKKN